MLSHHPITSAPLAPGRLNLRHCAAQDPMSLPRKRQKLNHKSDDDGSMFHLACAPPQPSQQSFLQKKNSQELEGNLSASKWFDSANSHIGHGLPDLSGYDSRTDCSPFPGAATHWFADEPPFFISLNDASSSGATEYGISDSKRFGENSQQDSEKIDLRDVIDDLTIENRRLKQLLKDRKSRKDSEDRDKLFEIRVHGLPSEKRRELEILLRDFASNLNVNSELPSDLPSEPLATENINVDFASNGAPSKHVQTDSGYASNSNSGQTCATPSNPGRPLPAVPRKSHVKTVKSYLHNIPDGLLPRQPLVMSERARMALVVRRLEDLFTGKNAAPGEHSQPLQQQEVSRLAATAEPRDAPKHNRQEGSREAHILPFDSDINVERLDSMESFSSDSKSRSATKSEGFGKSTPGDINSASGAGRSPDQRPTRPLDLDVHRAQVAEENLEYLRHLGLTSPKLNAEGKKEEGGGWLYLNLLISMAQLHTINVTPAFIRKSIRKLSTKFELSEDGNQVRWKESSEATDVLAGTVRDLDLVDGHWAGEVVGPEANKADKSSHRMATANKQTSATPREDDYGKQLIRQSSMLAQAFSDGPELSTCIPTSRTQPASAFDYKPIILTGKSLVRPNLAHLDDSTGSQSHLDGSSTTDSNDDSYGAAEHADTGAMVFYNNTVFCIDSSPDRAPTTMAKPTWDKSYRALGAPPTAELDEGRDGDVSYFSNATVVPVSEQSFDEVAFDLPPMAELCDVEHEMQELPASGIGGVIPQDNFRLDVKIVRSRSERDEGMKGRDAGDCNARHYTYQVESCSKIDLAPSPLPSPSYIFLPFLSSSSSGVEGAWGSDDEGADTSIDEHEQVGRLFPTDLSTEEWSRSKGEDDMETDSSIDMLASARQKHPSMIAAQEREFELNRQATLMDKAIVTGSLAATAGHGSDSDSDETGSYMDSDDDS